MGLQFSDNFQVNAPKPLDNKSGRFTAGAWRPFNDIIEAQLVVEQGARYKGLTQLILKAGIPTEYWYRDGITNSHLVEKSDSGNNILPYGLKGQIIKVSEDNTNTYTSNEPLTYGTFIKTDEELIDAKEVFITQQEIFNTWLRFSSGSQNAGALPSLPVETNSWAYRPIGDYIISTLNTASFAGFVSYDRFSNYRNKATLSSASGGDNDWISLVIAFVEDPNDMVPNTAFGLNPLDFNWPINTTDAFIPNQHTISALRGRNNNQYSYAIVYDYNRPTSQIIATSSEPWNTGANWAINTTTVELEVIRDGDLITVRTTDFSDAPGGAGTLRFPIVLDLNSNVVLNKFKGPARYGYGSFSQSGATFRDIEVTNTSNEIYDLRNGDVWVADTSGVYSLAIGRNIFNEILPRTFIRNTTTGLFAYIKEDSSFDVIVEEEEIPNLQSVTTAGNSTTNAIVIAGSAGFTGADGLNLYSSGGISAIINRNSAVNAGKIEFNPNGLNELELNDNIIYEAGNAIAAKFFGRVSGNDAVAVDEFSTLNQLNTALLDVVLKSGSTMTGDLILSSAIPSNALSAAPKSYIDNLITGITWKNDVKAATTVDITLSGTQTIDGVALLVGDRVLVKNQTLLENNGIYVVASGAWTRPSDADSPSEINTATVAIRLGTIYKNTQWTCTSTVTTLGTDPITFGQISGAGTYVNGTGILLTGNVFSADPAYISTATQTALNLKANLAGGNTFTGIQNINDRIIMSPPTGASSSSTTPPSLAGAFTINAYFGSSSTKTTGTAFGGNVNDTVLRGGHGGNSLTSSGARFGGTGGSIQIIGGDGGTGGFSGGTSGNGGDAVLQGGSIASSSSVTGLAGAAVLKGGLTAIAGGVGGDIFLYPGWGNNLGGSTTPNLTWDGNIFLGTNKNTNQAGAIIIGSVISDLTNRFQVTGNSIFTGKVKVTSAPVDPTDVVRLSDVVVTNLALGTRTNTTLPITNSNGTGFIIPEATPSLAGLISGTNQTKLDAITGTNTGNQSLSLGTSSGSIIISGTNNITLPTLGFTNNVDANVLGPAGFKPFTNATGSTNFPATAGVGFTLSRNGVSSALGQVDVWKENVNNGNTVRFRSGISSSTFSNWETFASQEWTTINFILNQTTQQASSNFNISGNGVMLGNLSVGLATSSPNVGIRNSRAISGSSTGYGNLTDATIMSPVTAVAYGYRSLLSTEAAVFTLPSLVHFDATQGTFGAGSIVTSQIGYSVAATFTGATNNYGFYGNIAAGTNRWNIHMLGTAQNYLAGNLGLGVIVPTEKLDVVGNGKFSGTLNLGGALTGTSALFSGELRTNGETLIVGNAGSNRVIRLSTGIATPLTRWALIANSTAESGSNVGSDFTITRYNDAGTSLGAAMTVTRSTGNVAFSNNVTSAAYNLSALNTAPASATAAGTTGEIRVTAGFIYVCTATNTWVRTPLATW